MDYLVESKKYHETYYTELLVRFPNKIVIKRRGKLVNCVLILPDNTPALNIFTAI